MFSELLTASTSEPMRRLLASSPCKPYSWALATEQQNGSGVDTAVRRQNSLVDYLSDGIRQVVENGGIAKTYVMGGQMIGLCTTWQDDLASHQLGTRTFRIGHLLANGNSEARTLIKTLLVRETMREIGGRTGFVTQIPYTDVTSINVLEQAGFTATQTSILLAKDLLHENPGSGPNRTYEVGTATLDEVDELLHRTATEIPEGIVGWDIRLPSLTRAKVHRDWLRSYAEEQNLLVAHHHGEPVGLLARHIRTDTSPYLGFSIGSIDLVATMPEYRNNGVVTQLVSESLQRFRNEGVRFAEVIAYSKDAPVVRYCQSQGFAAVESSLVMVNWRN